MEQNSKIISNENLERLTVNHTELLLDNQNPRFLGEDINTDILNRYDLNEPQLQEYLRQTIYSKYNVQELVYSISEIGFLKLDPIITVKVSDCYRVVEGNRRLTAIKTIHGGIKRKTMEVSDHVLKSISDIEIVNLKDGYNESMIWMLQGVRHVSGVRDWGPFQQAELIKSLYYSNGMTYKQISSVIGLSPQRISTILKAYCGVAQMMENETWAKYATPDLFSYFEQAYVRGPVRDWLGWDKDNCIFSNFENLEKFYDWIVNDDPSVPRTKIKSRDVRDRLPVVFEHEEAKTLLVNNKVSIDEAYSIATTGNSLKNELLSIAGEFSENLNKLKLSSEFSTKEKNILKKLFQQLAEIV